MQHAPPDLVHRLKRHHQEHLLAGWDALGTGERVAFIEQLAGVDFVELEELYRRRNEPHAVLPSRDRIAGLPVEEEAAIGPATVAIGEQALRNGEVAALLVAGGQGSRLGFDKPKGMFPAGPVSGASLFQLHSERVVALSRKYGKAIPFLVMTSPATHTETVEFFESRRFFGLAESQVRFFQQGTMPAMDLETGRLLLEHAGSLCLSPNGHGGALTALADSGLLDELKQDGVRHIFYFQIDNPLVKIADPAFLGRHIQTESEASSKVVYKEEPGEKVGVLALVDGRKGIIEYSDMSPRMAEERNANGELVFRAGNPAIHLFSVAFLERVTSGADRLGYHVARKKVPFHDPATGETIAPTKENALKFERFIFDALPLADRWLAVRVHREDEFAPLKNATGIDSVETCKILQVNRAGKWLESAGVVVPRDGDGNVTILIEIRPTYALNAEECKARLVNSLPLSNPTLLE